MMAFARLPFRKGESAERLRGDRFTRSRRLGGLRSRKHSQHLSLPKCKKQGDHLRTVFAKLILGKKIIKDKSMLRRSGS